MKRNGKFPKPRFPKGWDEARVNKVMEHYDRQTEDERAAEIEAAVEVDGVTMVAVPSALVPEVMELIARQAKAKRPRAKPAGRTRRRVTR